MGGPCSEAAWQIMFGIRGEAALRSLGMGLSLVRKLFTIPGPVLFLHLEDSGSQDSDCH